MNFRITINILLFGMFFNHYYSGFTQSPGLDNQDEKGIVYMLTYDHGGLILWGSDHFRERLRNAVAWLDKYPSFKIGLDGSKIATVPTYDGEGAQFGITTVDNWILTRYPGPECDTPMEDFRENFNHINPLLASRADDSGLRREDLVKEYENNPLYTWILLDYK